MANLQSSAKSLVDIHRPAQDAATETSLPMTVFYHPDWAYSYAESGARILRDKKTEKFVTWLPATYLGC